MEKSVPRPVQEPPRTQDYYVYAVFCEDESGGGHVKIGYSQRIDRRIACIKMQAKWPVKLVAVNEVGGVKSTARQIEYALHRAFRDRAEGGEWFQFDFRSKSDKREFNDGCRAIFRLYLGDKVEDWTRIDMKTWEKVREEHRRDFKVA